MTALIIAIDGPAAAGKGTLARRLATHYGLPHLDTGLLYRITGRRVLDAGGDPTDVVAAEAAVRGIVPADLNRDDLRGPVADEAASQVAAFPAVRGALLDYQRQFAGTRGAVLDGRDIGTVIFPDATAKLFVTASAEARGERRYRELRARGVEAELGTVIADIRARDAADEARAVAPLRPARDAMVLDTTELDPEAAFERVMQLLRTKLVDWTDVRCV